MGGPWRVPGAPQEARPRGSLEVPQDDPQGKIDRTSEKRKSMFCFPDFLDSSTGITRTEDLKIVVQILALGESKLGWANAIEVFNLDNLVFQSAPSPEHPWVFSKVRVAFNSSALKCC